MTPLRRSLESNANEDNPAFIEYGGSINKALDGDAPNMTSAMQDDLECNMDCRDGECRLGRAIYGFAAEILEDEDNIHYAHHNATMHCVCPPGWTGSHCEIKLVKCPSNQLCFNERPCVMSEDDYGRPFWHCECDAQQTDFGLPYVAHFCGQISTSVCRAARFSTSHSFCQNGGRCLALVTDPSQPHKGCECTKGWEGPHCSHVEGTLYKKEPTRMSTTGIVLLSVGLALSMIILCALVCMCQRRRQNEEQILVEK